MDDQKIEQIYFLMKEGKDEEAAKLQATDEELDVVQQLLQEDEQNNQASPESSELTFGRDSSIEAAALGFAEKASFDWLDEAYGAMKAILSDPNDKRPFQEKYREAQQAFEKMSNEAYGLHAGAYTAGGVAGTLLPGAGIIKAGAIGVKGAIALGGAAALGTTKGDAPMQEKVADTLVGGALGVAGEAAGPYIKKGAKYATEKVNDYTGHAIPQAMDWVKERTLGFTKEARQGIRNVGAKFPNFRNYDDLRKRRGELASKVGGHAETFDQHLQKKIDQTGEAITNHLNEADKWYEGSKAGKAVKGPEVASIVQKAISRLQKQRNWVSLNEPEKQKFLKVLKNLKQKTLFATKEDSLKYGALQSVKDEALSGAQSNIWKDQTLSNLDATAQGQLNGIDLDKQIEDSLNALTGGTKTPKADTAKKNVYDSLEKGKYETALEYPEKLKDELKVAGQAAERAENLYQDLSLSDLDSIIRDIQDLTYSGATVELSSPMGPLKGTIKGVTGGEITRRDTRKIFVDMDHDLRNLQDQKADVVAQAMGKPNDGTLRALKTDQHANLQLRDKVPSVNDLKTYAQGGKLSDKSVEIQNFMESKPLNETHQELQGMWKEMEPDFNEFDVISKVEQGGGSRAGLQFRAGSMSQAPIVQGAKTAGNVGMAIAKNYVIPREITQVDALTPEAVGFLGDNMGIPGALAKEEIMHAKETGDDVSLERHLGEIAPMMEGFTQPTPVMTSKGRARSAIVDRTGVQARIVDPMERNAIRDDIWKNDSISTMDKMKKVQKLNKTEKVDLEKPDLQPTFPEGMTQVVAPPNTNPQDVYQALQ